MCFGKGYGPVELLSGSYACMHAPPQREKEMSVRDVYCVYNLYIIWNIYIYVYIYK